MRATALTTLLLLAATLGAQPRIETFPVPPGHLPTEIARHGDVMAFVSWTNWPAIEPHLGRIGKNGKLQMQALEKDHMPGMMAQGPDGSLWLSDGKKKVLWRVLPNGKVERVSIGRTTLGITVDADGTIWSTHPESADVTRYSEDGSVQAAAFTGKRRVERVAPPTNTPPPAPKPPVTSPAAGMPLPEKKKAVLPPTTEQRKARMITHTPAWLTIGPDGAAWFSDPKSRTVGRVSIAGEFTRFALPKQWGQPGRIVAGKDGALWFTVNRSPVLARVTKDGEITSVGIPTPAAALASDAKGRIWFSDGNTIGYLDAAGVVQSVSLPAGDRMIRSMAEGPDGAMWFADQKGRVVGRITVK